MLTAERPMTLRQLYYRLVSAGLLKNRQAEYKRLGALMTRLREARIVPRTWIVDHVRTGLKPSSWSGLADFADSVRDCYRKDFWAHLPDHLDFFVEKDAVAGTVQPVTAKYDIGLQVCRGYASVSFAGEIADQWSEIEKPIYAFYLGDFDASGFDIERDLRAKLERYSNRVVLSSETPTPERADELFAAGAAGKKLVYWRRLGVADGDFEGFGLIELPVKKTDNRAAAFLNARGNRCAEIDALPPSELRRRVEDAILAHIPVDTWDRLVEVEAAEQETLDSFTQALAAEKSDLGLLSSEGDE
jgi:hypothetical protein